MSNSSLRFDHLALRVRDPAATLSFYADTLGLPLIASFTGGDWGGMDWLMMIFALGDDRQLALCALEGPFEPPATGVSDLPHYAFSAPNLEALEDWRQRLRRSGISFNEEEHGAQQSIYFSDPNGVTLEITSPASTRYETADEARTIAARWIASHQPHAATQPTPSG